jgi:hypothetical protein
VEIIIGLSEQINYEIYPKEDLSLEVLLASPEENLKMIENNIRNAKLHKQRKKQKMPKE